MPKGYMIEKIEDASVFVSKMRSFDENSIECTPHTLFRLSEGQRKVFACDILKGILLNKVPLKVCIQYNGNYATYYKYKEQSIIKIIVSIKTTFIRIVTFMIVAESQIPK